MYVVLVKCRWENLQTIEGLPLKCVDSSIGFLPLYSSREEAERVWPGCSVLEIVGEQEVGRVYDL